MSLPASSLVCAGCGATPPVDELPLPFRCRHAGAGDDVDHVMRRILDPQRVAFPRGREANPFLRYRSLLHSYHLAVSRGRSDADYLTLVQRLDREILRVDGQGFVVTPLAAHDRLGARLGFAPGRLWVKDETVNVSGSHKARHLFGVMLYLQIVESSVVDGFSRTALAIASCGNAALAAAVVARAAGRDLDVYVPTWADEAVVARLRELGAHLTTCPREPGAAGDPCYQRFQAEVRRGAIPFCCQGPDNGLTIEGGATLAWEMIDALGDRPVDRLFVQVGGGALASACALGLADALRLGRIGRMPRLHAVQTRGGFPLKRAYDRLIARIVDRLPRGAAELKFGATAERMEGPTGSDVGPDFSPAASRELADFVRAHADSPAVREELRYAATHRSQFMWPWETEPKSIATGILDDETYDWLAVVEGMVTTGGWPIVVDEDMLGRTNALARETTGINVDHTGTAGLAGVTQAIESDPRVRGDTVAVIFSGVQR